jgi:hypothetical protein
MSLSPAEIVRARKQAILTVPHSGTRMISDSLSKAKVKHRCCNAETYPHEEFLPDTVIGHVYTKPWPTYKRKLVVVRDPMDTLGTFMYQVRQGSGRQQPPDELVRAFQVLKQKMGQYEWCRVEDQFDYIGGFCGFVGERQELWKPHSNRHSRGDYYVKTLIQERYMFELEDLLPLDWYRKAIAELPMYQDYELWWM